MRRGPKGSCRTVAFVVLTPLLTQRARNAKHLFNNSQNVEIYHIYNLPFLSSQMAGEDMKDNLPMVLVLGVYDFVMHTLYRHSITNSFSLKGNLRKDWCQKYLICLCDVLLISVFKIIVEILLLLQATVGFTLFGKESLVELDVNEIVAETN